MISVSLSVPLCLCGSSSPSSRELEIGFGRGHFIRERAAAHPETEFVAIEWRKKWERLLAPRLARAGVSNVTLLIGDAAELVRRFENESFERIHIHFPDPWWKRRHLRRRLLGRAFVPELARILAPRGAAYVQTDVLDYARVVLTQFEGARLFENAAGPLAFSTWADEIPERSHREERCTRDGTPFVQMKFVKLED